MNKMIITFLSALAMVTLSSPLYAAAAEQNMTGSNEAAQSVSADAFEGMQVVSREGKEIGEITAAHADMQSGQVQFVTVSRSDADREQVAVPLEALEFDRESREATLKVDESKLANAPKQADKPMQVFLFELEDYYGVAPAWQEEGNIMGPPVPPIDVPGQQTESQ